MTDTTTAADLSEREADANALEAYRAMVTNLEAENEALRNEKRRPDDWQDALITRLKNTIEQAEARVDQLTDQLALANDTLRHRTAAMHRIAYENDTLRAKVARVEKIRDTWDGYGHGDYNIHPAKSLPCSVCDLLHDIRTALALADQEPAK